MAQGVKSAQRHVRLGIGTFTDARRPAYFNKGQFAPLWATTQLALFAIYQNGFSLNVARAHLTSVCATGALSLCSAGMATDDV